MVLDTSALMAILLGEPEARALSEAIAGDPKRLLSAFGKHADVRPLAMKSLHPSSRRVRRSLDEALDLALKTVEET